MLRALARLYARVFGWRLADGLPATRKYVLIGYPHTSNWDFVAMLMFSLIGGVKFSWVGKQALFRRPYGGVMRRLGGIPVDRSRSQGAVEQLVEAFKAADELILIVTPEGTRGHVDHWRSGFYHVAVGAGVPVGLGYVDWEKKTGSFAVLMDLTGDVATDMGRIRAFYEGRTGKRPELAGTIRLREEDAAAPPPATS